MTAGLSCLDCSAALDLPADATDRIGVPCPTCGLIHTLAPGPWRVVGYVAPAVKPRRRRGSRAKHINISTPGERS